MSLTKLIESLKEIVAVISSGRAEEGRRRLVALLTELEAIERKQKGRGEK